MPLPKEIMQLIVAEVVKEQKKQTLTKSKQQKDWRLRNTSLLLKNYRKLRVHNQEIVDDLTAYGDSVYDADELDLNTLMKYKAKTVKMLNYFDFMFNAYFNQNKDAGEAQSRRCKIVKDMYVSPHPKTADELADYWNIDRSTVFRDINKAIEELSVMLFGVDSFDDLI